MFNLDFVGFFLNARGREEAMEAEERDWRRKAVLLNSQYI